MRFQPNPIDEESKQIIRRQALLHHTEHCASQEGTNRTDRILRRERREESQDSSPDRGYQHQLTVQLHHLDARERFASRGRPPEE